MSQIANFKHITSRDNSRLKHARQVRDGKVREQIFVEGLRLGEEALSASLKILEVFVTESFSETERGASLLEKFVKQSLPVSLLDEKLFASISDTENPQGVCLLAEKPLTGKDLLSEKLRETVEKRRLPLIVGLHELNNPSNVGAILRTAEAVGVSGVILTKKSANPFAPKSLRSAMGAAFRLPMWTNAEFVETIEFCWENNLLTVCADVRAEKTHFEIAWNAPKALILGSEAHGLSAEELAQIDEALRIPMNETVESLNVAVAAGVVLYEAWRQRNQ